MTPEQKHKLFEEVMDNAKTENRSIEEITKDSMIEYGSYVIEDRAIPSMLDGLKPVQRRSLYSLKQHNLIGSKTVKLARIVGNVMGELHPHGDASIVGTFVNMSQPFKNNFMLLNPQGNYGSISNPDSHAAMRYIENGIEKKYADLLFENINKENVVSWQPNYDETIEEPRVLPVKYPYHLINGSEGIAYSMATKTPSFNIKEMTNLFIELIDDGFYKNDFELTEELKTKYMGILKGPDFKTGTNIYFDRDTNPQDILFNNQFSFRMRATYELNEKENQIIFKNIPYGVAVDKLVNDLIDMHMDYKEDGKRKVPKNPDDILNISTNPIVEIKSDDANIVLTFKKEADLVVELAKIFKGTVLDRSYTCNNTVISEDGVPVSVSVFQNLETFLYFRRHVVYSGLLHDIKELNKRIPLLEAVLKAIDKKEEFIQIVTTEENDELMKQRIMDLLDINEEQTEYLLNIQVRKLSKTEIAKLNEELEEKRATLAIKIEQSSSSEKLFEVIREDYVQLLEESIIKKANRNSHIIETPTSFEKEDLIKDREVILSLMSDDTVGWTENNIRAKARGTQTTRTGKKGEDLHVKDVIYCNLKSHLALITNHGRVFKVRGFDFTERFYHISTVLGLDNMREGEKIVSITNLDGMTNEKEILFITKNGYGSKSTVDFFKNVTKKRAIIGIRLEEGDEVLSFNIVNPEDDIMIITSKAKGLRFPVADVKMTKSASRGVYVYKNKDNDTIKSTVIIPKEDNNKDMVIVFEKGGLKKFRIEDLKTKKRNQVGLIISKPNDEDGEPVDGVIVEDENIVLLSHLGETAVLKPHDIQSVSRTARGIRKGIVLKKEDKVIKVFAVNEIEEEIEEELTEGVEISTIEIEEDTEAK